jgi:hypothetical protein
VFQVFQSPLLAKNVLLFKLVLEKIRVLHSEKPRKQISFYTDTRHSTALVLPIHEVMTKRRVNKITK